jgi:serine/threonine-protein kinase
MTPETLGRYTIESIIGEGAMGRVYRGFDPLARRAVAIKTIREEALSSATRDDYVRRFQREAQASASVIHPSIVTIFDVGETYFVMELVDGETLQSVLQRRGRLDSREAIGILAPIADALDYVHEKGLVHRDIKPANIMVLPNGRAKLMDFGVVHIDSSETMTSVGMAVGSPPYMAPEQILGREVTAQTDIFALGAVTYEILSGHRAFEAENVSAVIDRVVNEAPRPLRDENPNIPEHFEATIARALAKDPKARPATAMEFVAALHRGVDGTGARPAPAPHPEPAVVVPSPQPVGPDDATTELTAQMPVPVPATGSAGRRRGKAPAVIAAVVVLAAAAGLVVRGGLRKTATPEAAASPSTPVATATAAPPIPPVGVESEPSGGAVFLDDREVGKAPLELPLAAGEHVVRVTHDGFASAQLGITVTAEGHPPLRFDLEPVTAALSIRSEPSGSRVSVDGREVGTTPVEKVAVFPGSHRITVGQAGYASWSQSLNAVAGKPVDVVARLKPVPRKQPGNVEPTPEPPPVREGDLVTLGPDVTPPRKVSGKTASYPSAALEKRLEGKVMVELLVTETGEPKDLHVVQSAAQLLDDAVLDAIRSWRYEPAVKGGVKVRVVIRESQSFELRGSK